MADIAFPRSAEYESERWKKNVFRKSFAIG
jgi:hypothetical protein